MQNKNEPYRAWPWIPKWFFGKGSECLIAITMLIVVISGLWLSKAAGYSADLQMRRDLVRRAVDVATALNRTNVRALSFTAEDAERPEFQRITSQLQNYAEVAGISHLYTLALKDGQLLCGPSGALSGHPDGEREPGAQWVNSHPQDFALFETGRPQIRGPFRTGAHPFVTALAPVLNPYTGKVMMAVGMDVEASVWRAAVRHAQWIPLRITLGLMAILLFGTLILKRRQRARIDGQKMVHAEAILSAVFLLALTLVIALHADQGERAERKGIFYTRAQAHAAACIENGRDLELQVEQISQFFESSQIVTFDEFEGYCGGLIRGGVVRACAWIPEVANQEADQFVRKVRAEQFPDFSIWEANAKQERLPPANRSVHFPMCYVVSRDGHESALGYDLASDPARQAAIREAMQTGLTTASDPVQSIALPCNSSCIFVFQRVDAPQQKGVAALIIQLESLLGGALPGALDLHASLFGLQRGQEPVLLATNSKQCGVACLGDLYGELAVTTPLFRFGKTYILRTHPTDRWLAANPLRAGLIAGGIGLLLTALISSLILLLTNRRLVLEKLVERRTAELKANEQLLAGILNTIPPRVFWKDRQLRYLGCNRAFARDAGFENPDDLIGKDDDQMVWREQAGRYRADDRQVIESGQPRLMIEEPQTTPDGGTLTLLTSKIPLRDAEGSICGVLEAYMDITDRKEAEKRIEQSEARYGLLAEQSRSVAWEVDTDGLLTYCSHVAKKVWGYDPAEIVGKKHFYDLHPEEGREAFKQAAFEVFARKESFQGLENQIQTKEGAIIWVETIGSPTFDEQGELLGYRGSDTDITDRKEAEVVLKESEARLAQLFDHMHAGMAVYEPVEDGSDFIFVDMNAAGLRYADLRKEDIVGQKLTDVFPGIRDLGLFEVLQRVARTGEYEDFPLSRYHDSRIEQWVENHVFKLPSGQVVAMFNDLSDLKRAEQLAQGTLNALSAHIAIVDHQGLIVAVNEPWKKFASSHHLSSGFGVGSNYLDVCAHAMGPHSDDAATFADGLRRVLAGGQDFFEMEYPCETPEQEYWFVARVTVFPDSSLRMAAIAHEDITERKRAEEELKIGSARLTVATKAAGIGVWDRDIVNNVLVWDERMFEIYGVKPEAFGGAYEAWQRGVHPDDLARAVAEVAAAERGEKPFDTEFRIVRPDGEIRHIKAFAQVLRDDDGRPLRMIGVNYDITESKRAEEEREHLREFIQTVLDSLPEKLMVINRDYTIALANRVVREIAEGVDPVAAGLTCHQISHGFETPCDAVEHHCPMEQVIKTKAPVTVEHVHCDHRGRKMVVEVVAAPIFGEDDEVVQVIESCRDITDRKQAEERIRDLVQHLETIREEERKRLSRELHDDIGQILTAMKIDLMIVQEEPSVAAAAKEKIGDMQNLLSEGIQSVHSLCRRLRPGALDDLRLEDALSGLVDDWQQRNRIECELTADLEDASLSDGIKTAVFRMVQEALTNVSRYAEATWVGINLAADNESLVVSVADNGRGMEDGAESKPTSFGLLGMRERIEALGGTLHIESAPGKGTRIEGSIPLR